MGSLLWGAVLLGLAYQHQNPPTRIWLNDHFFVAQRIDDEGPDAGVSAQSLFGAQARAPNVCRDHIRRVLVLSGADGRPTTSIANGAVMPYVAFFESVYDVMPKALQRMFCSVSRLEVGSRPGGFLVTGVTTEGVELSFHRGLLDQLTSADTYYSWYEQMPWSANDRTDLSWRRDLPHTVFISEGSPIFALSVFAMSHAFGHLFDWAGDLTKEGASFSQLTWHDASRPLATSNFAGRAQLIWTPQNNRASHSGRADEAGAIQMLYREWAQSGFATMHASTDPSEDFADALALEIFGRLGRSQLWLYSGTGDAYELVGRMRKKAPQAGWGARILAEKRAYLQHFLASPDLVYP